MQNRVLNAANILIHRHPVVADRRVEGGGFVLGIGVAHEVPRRTHESVHGVCFALGGLAAGGAGHVDPGVEIGQR